MNDKARITAWLTADYNWLVSEKLRIERQTKGQKLCEIITKNKGQKALFYSNGYYDGEDWVYNKAS
jgi:hypothetical protein